MTRRRPGRSFAVLLLAAFLGACEDRAGSPATAGPGGLAPRFDIHYPGSAEAIEVPVAIVGNMPVIACRINGQDARLIIDTASGNICLFEDKHEKFGVELIGETPGGYTAAGLRTSGALGEFNLALPDGLHMIVTHAASLPPYPDPEIDGILGNPILLALNAVLDYEAMTLTLRKPDAGHATE